MQPRWLSFVEAVTNIVVGYFLAVVMQIIVFPLFGLDVSLGENLLLGLAFTVVSLARSYTLRRVFNWVSLADLPIRETPERPDSASGRRCHPVDRFFRRGGPWARS